MKTSSELTIGLALLLCASNLAAQVVPGTVLWSFDVGRKITTSPALGQNGAVYVGSDIALYAITNNGSVASNKWVISASVSSSPAIGADGTVYFVGGAGNNLFALSPDGNQIWISVVVGANGGPAIGFDGALYFVAQGRLYALDQSGAIRWDCLLESDSSHWVSFQSPVVGSDGVIYVGIADKLYAVSPDGTNKWSANLGLAIESSPAIGGGATLYVAAGPLYAFALNGTNLWAVSPDSRRFDGAPSIGAENSIYVGGYQSHILYTFDSAGGLVWQTVSNAPSSWASTSPAIDRAGNIYYCVSNSVIALNAQGQFLWTIYAGYTIPLWHLSITSPTIGPNGTLYAALGSTLYAIATGTNGPADSPWPMYRGNARHTGKIEKPALQQPKKRADANFEFQLYAQLGQTNLIETTTNLNTWTSLTSVVVTAVPQPVVDLTASNHPARFYRSTGP